MHSDKLELQSRTVTWMRFYLSVMVVFTHIPHNTQMGLIFCDDFCRCARPVFFLVSGYYFFTHLQEWNTSLWHEKLKKRVHTILIPFLLWNLIALCQYVLRAMIMKEPFSFSQLYAERHIFIDYPLWFLRDIMVLSLLAPAIHFILKKCGIWFFVAMLIFPLMCCWGSRRILTYAGVIYFSLGAYLQINGKDILSTFRKLGWWPAIVYVAMILLARVIRPQSAVLLSLGRYMLILSGVITLLSLSGYLVEKGIVKVNNFLASSNFFIYTSHAIFLGTIAILVEKVIPGFSSILLVIRGVITWLGTVAFCCILFYFMSRYLPKTTAVLNGKRL